MKINYRLTNIRDAIEISWMAITISTAFLMGLIFFYRDEQILLLTPTCQSVKYFKKECLMCGMTRAFLKLSEGKINEAKNLNAGSPILFVSIVFNIGIAIFYYINLYHQKRKYIVDDS